ncbi:hypothetical protein A3SI_17684 [Nitritalea halalkaliphila LW7]|uniref:SPOR domain-containing protein n=1 Tax=Nitritalea halalkaliphila LW7 TaxID=1189621 RepID=I5BVM0_9BACT|nr:SPOR domain-containing protein [Nitritalea halalkaliphila]EIM73622.1 hypothetical protein A3SI_17684 [Nitritalea halalkaliphila LW7]
MQEEQEKRDKDFGFPFVETVNLYQLNQKRERERIKRKKEEQPALAAVEKPAAASVAQPKETQKKRVGKMRIEEKKGPGRVAIATVFVLILGMLGLWYVLEFGLPMPEKAAVAIEERLEEEIPPQTEVETPELVAEETLSESEATETASGTEQQSGADRTAEEAQTSAAVTTAAPAPSASSGANQAAAATGAAASETRANVRQTGTAAEVMRLDGNNRKGNYYLIVASFPSEAVSLTEAKKYLNQTNNVYLLAPLDAKSNFRIAVAAFDTVEEGQRALPEARKTFGQGAWILKY